MRRTSFLPLVLVGAVAASPGGAPAVAAEAKPLSFAAGNLRDCEPAKMETPEEERIVLACFEGLTRLDPVTGAPKPGAASSWTTSPDGRTWTFTLRPQKWGKRFGEGVQTKEEVTASDFVFAWMRLLDPDVKSPSLHLLDVIPDARVIATEGTRGAALDRIANELQEKIGKNAVTLKGDDVITFVQDEAIETRRWLTPLPDPIVREFVGWKDPNSPWQGTKSKKLIEVLRAESKRSIAATTEARAHLGVDRGFFAKDDKTLVVQTAGAAPWLLSLLARGPLVPLRAVWFEKQRDNYFREGATFGNGPFLAASDLTRKLSGDQEKNFFKLVLHRNPAYWDVASVPSPRVDGIVNQSLDEVLRLYDVGSVPWVSSSAFTTDEFARLLGTKAPGWKPKDKDKLDPVLAKCAPDAFEVPAGSVCFLRLRCTPPFDKPDVRRAIASLVKPDALLKAWPEGPAPTTRRLVSSRITGASTTIRLPTFDPARAKALYGSKKLFPDDWINIAAGPGESRVADAIANALKGVIPDEAATWVATPEDLRVRIDSGAWQVAVTIWQPTFDDPLALLAPFTTGSSAGATGFTDPVYDALVKAAFDVGSFVAAPDAAIKDLPAVKAALAGASASDAAGLESLRRALLAEAEAILLDAAVVIPCWTTVERGLAKPSLRGLPKVGATRNVLDTIPLSAVAAGD